MRDTLKTKTEVKDTYKKIMLGIAGFCLAFFAFSFFYFYGIANDNNKIQGIYSFIAENLRAGFPDAPLVLAVFNDKGKTAQFALSENTQGAPSYEIPGDMFDIQAESTTGKSDKRNNILLIIVLSVIFLLISYFIVKTYIKYRI